MEQEIINLNKGISRSPSYGEAGEMSELVNLIPKRGELVGIAPPRDLGIEMAHFEELVYVHETYTFTHYIIIWKYIESDPPRLYYSTKEEPNSRKYAFEDESIRNILSVSSIGNTLIINTDKGLFYSIWRDGRYVALGELPEVNISFGLNNWQIERTSGHLDANITRPYMYGDVATELSNAIFATINSRLSYLNDTGYFCFPFFVRYALRLFDGTLTRHSPPVLMLPSSKETVHVYDLTTYSDGETSTINYGASIAKAMLDYRMITDISVNDWRDIIKSVDVFVSAPIYQYNPSGEVSIMFTMSDAEYEESYAVAATPNESSSRVYKEQTIRHDLYRYHFKLPPLDEERKANWVRYYDENGRPYLKDIYEDSAKVNTFFDNITDNNQFYLLESIDLEDLPSVGDAAKDIIPQSGYLSSLTTKETMTDDYRSHDKLYPKGTSVYNNRLNLSNVNRQLFGGFPTDVMIPYTNDGGSKMYFATEITEQGETFILYNECYNNYSYFGDYLYFPNPNAKKMIAIQGEPDFVDGNFIMKLSLTEHTGLNGAAFFSGFGGWFATTRLPVIPPTASDTNIIQEGNKIYTSEVNNPYLFPLGGINTIGTGKIVGISTITKALSQGQFGQFPLYVFASDGIWAMEVNSEGLYGSTHAVSRDVCNNANSITQIDNAVVFTTEQGLKMLQGSDVLLLSGRMDGINLDESKYNVVEGFEGLFVPDTEGFVEMLRTCRIVYDYPHGLLHIFPSEGAKHFVYSLEEGYFSSYVGIANNLKSVVAANPNTLIQVEYGLYDFGYYQSEARHKGLAITRPLALGDPFAMKILTDLRSVRRGGSMRIAVWGNNDINEDGWVRVPSLRNHSFKYHRFVLFTEMGMNDSVSGIGVRYDYRRANKMR